MLPRIWEADNKLFWWSRNSWVHFGFTKLAFLPASPQNDVIQWLDSIKTGYTTLIFSWDRQFGSQSTISEKFLHFLIYTVIASFSINRSRWDSFKHKYNEYFSKFSRSEQELSFTELQGKKPFLYGIYIYLYDVKRNFLYILPTSYNVLVSNKRSIDSLWTNFYFFSYFYYISATVLYVDCKEQKIKKNCGNYCVIFYYLIWFLSLNFLFKY